MRDLATANTTRDLKEKEEEGAFLPFSAPWFGPEEKNEILQALDSDWITTGPRCHALEEAVARYLGCREAVGVNSCTAALHLALTVLGIGPEDAVITSPFTFAATANVIVHCGAHPVFVDIRPDTCNLDPAALELLLEEKCHWEPSQQILRVRQTGRSVRAIIAVHYGGHPAEMDSICRLAKKFGLAVIEDAAHALGASYRGRKVGTLGNMACFSFHATKNITTGEGGMLATGNPVLAERARILSLHGISRDAWKRYGSDGSWQYDVEEAGFKYNLTDLAAALGIHQFAKLEQFIDRRAELAAFYAHALSDLPIQLPTVLPEAHSAWHLYPIQVLSGRVTRDDIIQELRHRNIGSSVHFIPLHLMTYYQRTFGYKHGDFPVAERVFARIVSLPFFPRMRNEDAERVIASLRRIFVP